MAANILSCVIFHLGNRFLLSGVLTDNLFEPLMQLDGLLGIALGGWIGIGPGHGIGLMLIIVGVLEIGWGIVGWAYKPLHFLEDKLPDAIPDAVVISDRDQLQTMADQQLIQGASS